jgi:hypothetical protein
MTSSLRDVWRQAGFLHINCGKVEPCLLHFLDTDYVMAVERSLGRFLQEIRNNHSLEEGKVVRALWANKVGERVEENRK